VFRRGPLWGGGVLIGATLALHLPPLGTVPAVFCTLAASVATLGNGRAFALVPAALGFLRGGSVRQSWEQARVANPLVAFGAVDVVAANGQNVLVRVGRRRVLCRDERGLLPSPGRRLDVTLRIDPFRSRADPAAFSVERWTQTLDTHGRGSPLRVSQPPEPTPGGLARLQRAAQRLRDHARLRLGSGRCREGDLLTALLLGDRSGLAQSERETFRRAGLAHVLALSGMHVGILSLGLSGLLRGARLRGLGVTGPLLLFLAAYAFLSGARPSILRASGTSGLAALGALLGRRSDPLHALGLVAAALVLSQPFSLLDLGFQLSFLAAALLALVARRSRTPMPGTRLARAAATLGRAAEVSAILVLGTSPVIAAAFGRLSLLSPVTNVAAAPLLAGSLGWGALAVALPGPDWLAEAFASAARFTAWLLLSLTERAARLPGSDVPVPAFGIAGTLLVLASAAALAARRLPGPRGRRLLVGLAVLAAAGLAPRERITFLDVGQGDAVLVETCAGAALVDGGAFEKSDTDVFPVRAVRRRGCTPLAAAIASHGDQDHVGGLAAVVRHALAGPLVVPAAQPPWPERLAALVASAESCACAILLAGGAEEPTELFERSLTVFSPWNGGVAPPGTSENDRSLVVRWRCGRALSALLTGDLETEGEAQLARAAAPAVLRALILKAGHHGARAATGDRLLVLVQPRFVVVSCGYDNAHGHPHPQTAARIASHGAVLLRTDRDGSVSFTRVPQGFRLRWWRGFPGESRSALDGEHESAFVTSSFALDCDLLSKGEGAARCASRSWRVGEAATSRRFSPPRACPVTRPRSFSSSPTKRTHRPSSGPLTPGSRPPLSTPARAAALGNPKPSSGSSRFSRSTAPKPFALPASCGSFPPRSCAPIRSVC
jgi:competence protein ComEC